MEGPTMSVTRSLTVLLLALLVAAAARADDLTEAERRELQKKAETLNEEAFRHYQGGAYAKAVELLTEVLDINRRLYPKAKFPNGHADLAHTLNALGLLHKQSGEYARAEPFARDAVAMNQRLYPREKFPDGHAALAVSLNNLGLLLDVSGDYAGAEPYYRDALAMFRRLYPLEKFPDGHHQLAAGLNNMGRLLQERGEYFKARPYLTEALEMKRRLYPKEKYPDGHPQLATSLNNQGYMFQEWGEFADAEPFFREALEMNRRLYPREKFPNGHPDLANSLNNLGNLLLDRHEYAQAEPFLNNAREMWGRLFPRANYPDGHPSLAHALNNLGRLFQEQGAYDRAEPIYREALAMWRRLFPQEKFPAGHPELARGLTALGYALQSRGDHARAEPLLSEALAMFQGLALRYADSASEAEALNHVAALPRSRDAFLSVTRHLPADLAAYDRLWESRASLTRLLERRHHDRVASRDDQVRDLARQLAEARQRLAYVLLNPGRDPEAHRQEVLRRSEAKEELEKRLARQLKLTPPRTDRKAVTPQRLCELLPEGAAFIDVLHYTDFDWDPAVPGWKGQKAIPRYVAFVLRRGRPAVRVELSEAAPIDAAWAAWRKAITAARPNEKAEREAAAVFARLVWEPLRGALPADRRTVYLAPEGPLSQVPWGALPGTKPDTILLDDCGVCLVPHGPFLLERLQEKAPADHGDTLVAYGGVDYARGSEAAATPRHDLPGPLLSEKARPHWADLPGTAREQEQVVALARKALRDTPVARAGHAAATAQLEQDLPKARYAHIATHGFFADPEFRSALQLDPKLFDRSAAGYRPGGARSPSVLSGLVLAGANRDGKDAAADHGIVTAEGLIGLRLEGLELAVLSACETGLGEEGGGEGVYGLQRAFHVAGCRNVIASLWKVDDGATQALMALFYRNLWERKLDAAEALRQAQLTLYRHPEAVAVAAKRGVDFSESDLPKVEEKPAEKPVRSPAAHWAAFTFSGVRPAR
jgi:CHAT domain-containing protein/Tfp pilus assembly protein PilF